MCGGSRQSIWVFPRCPFHTSWSLGRVVVVRYATFLACCTSAVHSSLLPDNTQLCNNDDDDTETVLIIIIYSSSYCCCDMINEDPRAADWRTGGGSVCCMQ